MLYGLELGVDILREFGIHPSTQGHVCIWISRDLRHPLDGIAAEAFERLARRGVDPVGLAFLPPAVRRLSLPFLEPVRHLSTILAPPMHHVFRDVRHDAAFARRPATARSISA